MASGGSANRSPSCLARPQQVFAAGDGQKGVSCTMDQQKVRARRSDICLRIDTGLRE
jgi:hypothetical protein